MFSLLGFSKRFFFAIGVSLLGGAPQVFAGVVELTAAFAPDPQNVGNDKFVNTTPNSGYCAYYPADCAAENMFSIVVPLIFVSSAPIMADHSNPREGAMIKVPADYRSLDVVSSTGDVKTLQLKINGLGANHIFSQDVRDITGVSGILQAHTALWQGGGWVYAAAPCRYSGVGRYENKFYQFFWKTPSIEYCAKKAKYDIENLRMETVNIAYELIAPDPLSMGAGNYYGSITYSVGPNGDFDFGDILKPTDSALTLNFTLSVSHVLQVQFPPGADRLSLVPDGGWQQWLHRGRRPEKLFANQPFQIWSSGRFNMQLQCQHTVGEQCGIRNESGHLVPVETRVTLPAGITGSSGMAVNRQLLSATNATNFLPSHYVDNGRASLHFEVGRDSVKDMTEHAGSRYAGNVTIIWDGQIDG